jgi:hypothetical protein
MFARVKAALRSAASHRLAELRTRQSTVVDRAFSVAGATVWNSLPDGIPFSPAIQIFRARLKTYLFKYSLLLMLIVNCHWSAQAERRSGDSWSELG